MALDYDDLIKDSHFDNLKGIFRHWSYCLTVPAHEFLLLLDDIRIFKQLKMENVLRNLVESDGKNTPVEYSPLENVLKSWIYLIISQLNLKKTLI